MNQQIPIICFLYINLLNPHYHPAKIHLPTRNLRLPDCPKSPCHKLLESCLVFHCIPDTFIELMNVTQLVTGRELKLGLSAQIYVAPKAALITVQQWSLRQNGHTPGSIQDDPFACGKNVSGCLIRFLSYLFKCHLVNTLYLHKITTEDMYRLSMNKKYAPIGLYAQTLFCC